MNSLEKFNLLKSCLKFDAVTNASVFNTLRILKGVNKGDLYHEAYLGHYKKRGNTFVDYYHLLWTIGSIIKPKQIMEIGCRTGISICQLLSSYVDSFPERIMLFDLFADEFLSEELVRLNLKQLNINSENIKFIVGDSKKQVPRYFAKNNLLFDYILVDGDHSRETARIDLDNVVPMLEEGGIIIFDDISPDGCGLIDVWSKFTEDYQNDFYFANDMNGKGVGIGVKK